MKTAQWFRLGVWGAVIVAAALSWSNVQAGPSDKEAKKARRTLITIATLDQMTTLPGEIGPLPPVPIPTNNPQSPAKIELGRQLFFDPRLSGNDHWACATCHNPGFGYSDGLPRSLGFGDEKELGRHSPSILNTAYNSSQFWDGRAGTLEDQAIRPIVSPREMNADPQLMIKKISAISSYDQQFQRVFGEPPSLKTIGMAIAAYERTVVSGESAFDRFTKGDKKALTDQEKRGLILFVSKAACTQCHSGSSFTDGSFHSLGLAQEGPLKEDLGRYDVTKDPKDKGAFKVPGLRNIEMTAPYMHTGALATLEAVVEFYNQGGGSGSNKSDKILKLNLTDAEKKDLVAFLKSLSGAVPLAVVPQLPAKS